MKIENAEVYGFRGALRGMRNPMNSWDRADTMFDGDGYPYPLDFDGCTPPPSLGPNDLKLAISLIKAGTDHRKFLRQIFVSVDLTIPRYLWQELDTYKVATVRNSCSTMHKLGHADLTPDDFQDGEVLAVVLGELNRAGRCYREKRTFITPTQPDGAIHDLRDYDIVRWMKKHMPEGYLQKATYTMSYETVLAILRSRGNHRLPEWSGPEGICAFLRRLPLVAMFEEADRSR